MALRRSKSVYTGNGLRRLDLGRDLESVTALIQLCFHQEQSARSSADLRSFSRELRTIHLLGKVLPSVRSMLTGFVWEHENRIIGNVSLSRLAGSNDRWLIGNVAVHPDFRRQGIARQLTEAALAYARNRRGRLVVLDVRSDNEPAYQLYRQLGFRLMTGVAKLARGPWIGPVPIGPRDVHVRRARPADWRGIYQLSVTTASPAALELAPPRPYSYQACLIERGSELLTGIFLGRWTNRFLAEIDGATAGMLTVQRSPRSMARIVLSVDPAFHGQVEEALLAAAHQLLAGRWYKHISAEVDVDHEEATQLLRSRGFVQVEVLHRLVKSCRP